MAILVIRARKLPKVEPIHVTLLLVILACNVSIRVFCFIRFYNDNFLQCTGILCDLPIVIHVSPHDLPYIISTGLR